VDEEERSDSSSSLIADDEEGTDHLEDEEGEEGDAYEDEDEEPALKYERVSGAVPDLLKKDTVSAMAVSSKELVHFAALREFWLNTLTFVLEALGTHAGIVHVLDLSGNRVKSYKPHQASVTDICMDATADFLATASLDGEDRIRRVSD
jgi:WD40 repeat protein